MEKQVYITKKEREKCRKVIDAFEELYEIEDEDILLIDVGRYGFVKLQCYTPSYGFEELDTYTDSNSLFNNLSMENSRNLSGEKMTLQKRRVLLRKMNFVKRKRSM